MTNKIIVQQQKGGQFFITIPKGIALAYGLVKGDHIELKINHNGRIELIKL